jgi:hypothetical protein
MDLISLKNEIDNKKVQKDEEQKLNIFEQVKEKVEDIEKEISQPKQDTKITPRIIVLDIDYEYPNGNKKSCKLTSKIMDNQARLKYEKIIATLSHGFIFEQLPSEMQNRYASLARIISQTIDTPDWLLEVCGEDLDFAYSLTLQLLEHEKRFFRYTAIGSQEAASKPRFHIDTKAFK